MYINSIDVVIVIIFVLISVYLIHRQWVMTSKLTNTGIITSTTTTNDSHAHDNNTSMTPSITGGGDTFTITEGRNSLCIVDKDTMKLTKYYIENNNDVIENMPLYIVVNGNVFEIRKHHELDMLRIIDDIGCKYYPKLYASECGNIEFDRTLFEQIPRYTIYDPDKIIIKRLVMEYVPYESLKSFMSHNGVTFDGRKLVENHMDTTLMISIYHKLFEIVYYFIDHNILPFDLDNVTNILVSHDINDDNNIFSFKCIDCAIYASIIDRQHASTPDVMVAWLYTIMYQSFCGRVNMIKILRMHYDCVRITRESLRGIVDDKTIDYILTNIVSVDETLATIKNATIKRLLGDNDVNTCSIRNVIVTSMYNHREIKRIVNDNKQFAEEIDNAVLSADKRNDDDLKNIYRMIYKHPTSSAAELEWLFMRVKSVTISNVMKNIAYVISRESSTNPRMTLYFSDNAPCFGYETDQIAMTTHGGNIKSVTTSRYIKLCPEYANISVSRTFIGYEQQNPKYNFDARHCMRVDIMPTEYFIFDFDVEDCLMNWCGILRGRSLYTTYAGLRLMRLNRPLFDEILNAVKTMSPDDVRAKYSVNNVMQRAVSSIIKCTSAGIDFDKDYDDLMSYINKHQSDRGVLYRGENSYDEFALHIGDEIVRDNIHTWSNNRLEAVRFCTDYYHCKDDLVRSRLLLVNDNTLAAKIHVPLAVPMDRIIPDWYEFIHRPCVYKITAIETVNEYVKYVVEMNKVNTTMTIFVVHLTEVN